MNYETEQNKSSSIKILLAKINASKRLIGFSLHSGSIYKLTNFDFTIINSIENSGVAMAPVSSIGAITVGKYFHDTVNKELYMHVTGGGNPNGSFIILNFPNFFSNLGISLSNDLASGFDVYWNPIVSSVSSFGVELDNEDQIGLAIEGQGTISFHNDRSYWDSRYEKYTWENQDISIYNTFHGLGPSEAKLLFKGKINKKSFNESTVNFALKDLISEIRQEFPVASLNAMSGIRITNDLLEAKQRRIYGRIKGHVLTPIDQVLDGYPLTGTVSATNGSPTLTGVGTLFLKEVSPEDTLIINGTEVTVEFVTSNIAITLSEDFTGISGSGLTIFIKPDFPKKYINRNFKAAGHAIKEPLTTVVSTNSLNQIKVASLDSLQPDDEIYVGSLGSGEIVEIDQIFVAISTLKLKQSLVTAPAPGTQVLRYPIQNVRLNEKKLVFYRDYTVDSDNGELSLTESAEFNVAPARFLTGTVTFTNTLRTVSGTGTKFTSQLKPGDYLRSKGNFDYFEILEVTNDTNLILRTAATYSSTAAAQYKRVDNFDETKDVLSADILGGTVEGTKTGTFIDTASPIVKDILAKINITNINTTKFTKSQNISSHKIGLAIPATYNSTDVPKARDIINQINLSILGSLVQNEDFEFEYNILNPTTQGVKTFREFDVLNFAVSTDNDRVVKTSIVQYLNKEFDYEALNTSFKTKQHTSNIGSHLVKTDRSKTIPTLLVEEESARIFATRWAFLLELGSSIIKIETKMQASRLQVNDVIDLFHHKLFERVGGGKRKLSAIQRIVKNHQDVEIETEDLSNAFNRVGMITENTAPNFDNSTEEQKFFNGFITDNFGLINNDPETFDVNLIW